MDDQPAGASSGSSVGAGIAIGAIASPSLVPSPLNNSAMAPIDPRVAPRSVGRKILVA